MRARALLALAVTTACAAPPATPSWQQIQRQRLERLHAKREPAAALAQVLRQDPGQDPQQPLHIDQREPRAPGTGPRRFQVPQFTASAAVGVGNVAARIAGTPLDDRADARFLRLGLEGSGGAAVHVEGTSSDAELFAGQRINDGFVPAKADAGLFGIDAFPHVRLDTGEGAWRMPVRVGVFADWQNLEHELAGVHREWIGFGPRLVLEPTWRLTGDGSNALDLVGHIGGDVGAAWFRESFHGGDDRDVTSRWSGEAGIALRLLFGSATAELGYRLQHTTFGAIDSDLYGDRSRTELQRQQVFFGFGITY